MLEKIDFEMSHDLFYRKFSQNPTYSILLKERNDFLSKPKEVVIPKVVKKPVKRVTKSKTKE